MRQKKIFSIDPVMPFLNLIDTEPVMLLTSNAPDKKNLLAIGKKNDYWCRDAEGAVYLLKQFTENNRDWLFGYLSYDLKNDIEQLSSHNYDGLGFPIFHFWQPLLVLEWQQGELTAHWLKYSEQQVDEIVSRLFPAPARQTLSIGQNEEAPGIEQQVLDLVPRLKKPEYLDKVMEIRQHIRKGDIYEMNFCQEFYAENKTIDPWTTFLKLNRLTEAPYATFLRDDNLYLMCASPEQFIKKEGTTLSSSPIKGTAKRHNDATEDERIKQELETSAKERAENIMIVDLVRNDLSRLATPASVKVGSLCEVHSFKTVHQMISAVSCNLKEGTGFADIIRAVFPMGSMTGAPKIRAMQLAEEKESTKRGLYSGAVGYIDPDGDFEFNVVIRSLLHNADNGYLSLMVGGAITDLSDPEAEYKECLLKAEAIMNALKQ